ncbi:MAG: dodecin [Aquisalimonadaceae bacterium]
MNEHVYKLTEVVGSSSTSIEDAIQGAIARTAKTVDNVEWFQVVETRGQITDGKVAHYQVVLKIGFRLQN